MDFELVHPDYQEKVPTEEKKETPKLPGSDQFKQYRKEARKKFKKVYNINIRIKINRQGRNLWINLERRMFI